MASPLSPLLPRLAHALSRISTTTARTIASPPTQPRRASVALLLRVRPCAEDEQRLSEEYDADGLPLPGSEGARMLLEGASGIDSARPASSEDKSESGSRLQPSQVDFDAMAQSSQLGESFTSSLLPDQSTTLSQTAASALPSDAGLGASSFADVGSDVDSSRVTAGSANVTESARSHHNAASTSASASASASQRLSASSTDAGAAESKSTGTAPNVPQTLNTFFDLSWVKRGTPELLYIKRSARQGDKWSAHVAFPGGRREEGDENGLYTAMRETWEEVGLDLAESEFLSIGQLDDREITTSLGKRLLMVLSPYVFLQTSPFSPLPELQETEVASAHWIPLDLLYTPKPKWGLTSVDIASRLAPKSPAVRWALRALHTESDEMEAVLSQTETLPNLNQLLRDPRQSAATIWSVLRDELHLTPPPQASALAPSMTSVFPRFSYPDVNL
ncbi:peroxisomal nudix hydrolase [Ceraceosorus bombacis]|uniref:Peroxisomal nudix hydrolase n=1 Tax=Ceraceosorus bombacis TaxID=401625 RepID=A0A0P1BJD4_9BASI|nr:peroxisomal nudix hydrolase [Ceraceosorus bombacis]